MRGRTNALGPADSQPRSDFSWIFWGFLFAIMMRSLSVQRSRWSRVAIDGHVRAVGERQMLQAEPRSFPLSVERGAATLSAFSSTGDNTVQFDAGLSDDWPLLVLFFLFFPPDYSLAL